MSSLLPVAVYGLKVPAGDVMMPAARDFPASFRITMAAIDPSASSEHSGTTNGDTPARATLKIVYDPRGNGDDDSSDADSEEEEYLQALLNGNNDDEDEESSSDEEETNGGPSDPSKTKKARKQAALEQILKGLNENSSDNEDEMEVDGDAKVNGDVSKPKSKKGKGKASILDDNDEEEEVQDEEEEMEELVLCTLDPLKTYQQPLDITIAEDQSVFFKVSGTHAIYLTGNYVIPADDGHNHKHEVYNSDEEDDYDLSPNEDELDLLGEDDESDELDDLDDPRITEMASDEEESEAPKLIKNKQPTGKGNKKRAAEDSEEEELVPKSAKESAKEPAKLDDMMAKSLKPEVPLANGEPKLSKKQLKKLKNNAGQAVAAAVENKNIKVDESSAKDSPSTKSDKKVQFAKNLEQGPSPAKAAESKAPDPKVEAKKQEADSKKNGATPKVSLGPKMVQGVKVDDKKLGTGPAAKPGNKVGMRYIGKLEDGKVFDANKKGKPFTFKLGAGEVIKGWDIGVAGMSVGGERRIHVPAHLAYGSKSQQGIPANSPLIFDVKMLEIQ